MPRSLGKALHPSIIACKLICCLCLNNSSAFYLFIYSGFFWVRFGPFVQFGLSTTERRRLWFKFVGLIINRLWIMRRSPLIGFVSVRARGLMGRGQKPRRDVGAIFVCSPAWDRVLHFWAAAARETLQDESKQMFFSGKECCQNMNVSVSFWSYWRFISYVNWYFIQDSDGR